MNFSAVFVFTPTFLVDLESKIENMKKLFWLFFFSEKVFVMCLFFF